MAATSTSHGLAVGPQSTLATVEEVLNALAARDRSGEVLTAIAHPCPRGEVRAHAGVGSARTRRRLSRERRRPALHASGRGRRSRPRQKGLRCGHAHGLRQNALLQLARPERRARKSGHARAVSLPHQGARAGSARRAARSFRAPRRLLRRLHLRRRHAVRRAQGDSRARPHRASAIPTCCTPASCRTTRAGSGCSKICATSCWTNCTPIAASSAATWPTCCGGCGASRDFTARTRNSSARRRRSRIPANWPRGWPKPNSR